jgi:ATP-dependent helicase/nuclease subunit B
LGMAISEIATHFFQSVKNERVIVVNNGIPLQELNQLIFRDFKYLILMGVDSGVLPPTPGGNFLYQPHQLESVFGLNNSYLLSQFHLSQVTGRSENLYIVSAQHEDGKPLEVSQLIQDLIPSMTNKAPFKIDTAVLNKDDLLNNHERIKLDANSEAFLKSLQNCNFTQYDGKLSEFDHTIGYLSASQLNTYATCPLKYFFNYILKLNTPSDESEGFEVFEIGSIMHSVFEKFSIEIMEGDYVLPETLNQVVKNRILKITDSVYQEMLKKLEVEGNIYHKMTLKEMIKGLKDEDDPGVIRTFLDYIYDPEQQNHFMLTHLSGIEHKISPDDFEVNSVPITGFIDRVDSDPTAVKLIDYKSTKNPRELKIVEKMKDLKEFQLPLYLLYAKDHLTTSSSQKIEAFLFSLMAKKEYARIHYHKGKVSFQYKEGRKEIIEEVDDYLDLVKDQISSIHHFIKKGSFAYSLDEDACDYCDFTTMCHKTVLEKEVAR